MNVAIVGCRNVETTGARPVEFDISDFIHSLPQDTVIVTGDATGVDYFAWKFAGHRGLRVIRHVADWNKHGRAAGPLRNTLIVRDADRVVAWWDGKSRGTANTIKQARQAGKPVDVRMFERA